MQLCSLKSNSVVLLGFKSNSVVFVKSLKGNASAFPFFMGIDAQFRTFFVRSKYAIWIRDKWILPPKIPFLYTKSVQAQKERNDILGKQSKQFGA